MCDISNISNKGMSCQLFSVVKLCSQTKSIKKMTTVINNKNVVRTFDNELNIYENVKPRYRECLKLCHIQILQ